MMLLMLKKHKWGQVQVPYVKMNMWSVDFMHPLVQVTMFMNFLRMRTKSLLRIQLFGSTLILKT